MLNTFRIYILATFAAIAAMGQDCRIPINFSVVSNTISPATSAPFNNKGIACVNWQMNVFVSGLSALSIQLESASDLGGNTPGTFAAFGGTLLSGTNPITATTQATSTFTGMFPWLRVNPTSATGTGNIVGVAYGFKATSSSINPAFGATGAGAFLGTFTPCIASNFTPLHSNVGHNFVQYLTGCNFNAAVSTAANTYDFQCVPISNIATTAQTITAAMQISVSNANNTNFKYGLGLAGTSQDQFLTGCGQNYCNTTLFNCPGTFLDSCSTFAGNGNSGNATSLPFFWERFKSDGAGHIQAFISNDGVNFTNNGQSFADNTGGATKACLTFFSADNNWATSVNYVSFNITTP